MAIDYWFLARVGTCGAMPVGYCALRGLNMKLVPSLLVLAIAVGVVPAAEAGQKARLDPDALQLAAADTGTVTDQSTSAGKKYDAVLGACQFVEVGNPFGSAINDISPLGPIDDFLKALDIKSVTNVILLDAPKHGTVRRYPTMPEAGMIGAYHYFPDADFYGGKKDFYKGSDQFGFEVEANGKRFKVIYTVYVVFPVGDEIYNPINNSCPQPEVSWRISEGGKQRGQRQLDYA